MSRSGMKNREITNAHQTFENKYFLIPLNPRTKNPMFSQGLHCTEEEYLEIWREPKGSWIVYQQKGIFAG